MRPKRCLPFVADNLSALSRSNGAIWRGMERARARTPLLRKRQLVPETPVEQGSSSGSRTAYSYSVRPPKRTGEACIILQTDAAGVSVPVAGTFGSDLFPELSGAAKQAADESALGLAQYIAAALTAFDKVYAAQKETTDATT